MFLLLAQTIEGRLKNVGQAAGYKTADSNALPLIAGQIIRGVIAILGILFLGLALYGGYLWMTARGDEAQVKKAKSVLEESTIGLVIMLAAYAITTYVLTYVVSATLQ